MECLTVSCDIDDYCLLLRESRPIARKINRCTECRRLIFPGEKYLVEVTIYDGNISTSKTCPDCESIRKTFFKDGFFYGETKWMLRDHVYECRGDIAESILSVLTPGARSTICSMIEDVWEDYDDDDE